MRLILVNPNTTAATTQAMVAIAAETAGPGVVVTGMTAAFGAPLITDPQALHEGARAVVALAPELAGADGVIVAGFGDPGLEGLRAALPCPVTGIAEAGMAEAAAGGRRFAVVTTTPDLVDEIARTAAGHGHGSFMGTWLTPGDPVALTADPVALPLALEDACHRAIAAGAEAIVIGGGPLAVAARAIADRVPVPLIEPVPAAVRLSLVRLRGKAPA
jgi:Asp/Glu/hydantoin racemase